MRVRREGSRHCRARLLLRVPRVDAPPVRGRGGDGHVRLRLARSEGKGATLQRGRRFRPEWKERVLLGAHWDTRPWATRTRSGQEGFRSWARTRRLGRGGAPRDGPPDEAKPAGRGCGHRVLRRRRPGTRPIPTAGTGAPRATWTRSAARNRPSSSSWTTWGKDPALHWKGNSRAQATNIVDLVWGQALPGRAESPSDVRHRGVRRRCAVPERGHWAIDIIDFDCTKWRTTHDTPKVSREPRGGRPGSPKPRNQANFPLQPNSLDPLNRAPYKMQGESPGSTRTSGPWPFRGLGPS